MKNVFVVFNSSGIILNPDKELNDLTLINKLQ